MKNSRNLLEVAPSVDDTVTLDNLPQMTTTPRLYGYEDEDVSVQTAGVVYANVRATQISNVIKNLIDAEFAARETFGKMCNAFCGANGLSNTCCQYVSNNIKSTSEYISDTELLENSDLVELAAIVELTTKYSREISHVTAVIQSAPCLQHETCPLSEDLCQDNMDTQFCSLVHFNERLTAFSKSCQQIIMDTSQSTTTSITTNTADANGDLYTVTEGETWSSSRAAPTKLSRATMDANRDLYTVARMIEGFNVIMKILRSLD